MFCFDGFGIKYQEANENMEGDQSQEEWQGADAQQDLDGKQIFQPYLAKFMCNVSDGDLEGGNMNDVAADRFLFYNVDDVEHLKEETNFNETLPRESSRFISKEELDEAVNNGDLGNNNSIDERDLVRAYAKTL